MKNLLKFLQLDRYFILFIFLVSYLIVVKNSGTYTVDSSSTPLAEAGLITGATYNPSTKKVYLVGYSSSLLQPLVWVSENFANNDVFSGTNTKTSLTSLGFEQTESITHIGANRYFITSETFNFFWFLLLEN